MRYAVHARCARVIERLAYHSFASVTHLGQPIWKATFCPLLQVQVLIVTFVILSQNAEFFGQVRSTGFLSQGRARLSAFQCCFIAENTQPSPSLTQKPCREVRHLDVPYEVKKCTS